MDNELIQESGILLVDKPGAWTSHDVVKFIRGFGFKKVGHCGTLDPQATGLLVVVLGRATKLTDRFSGHAKAYDGVAQLGTETYSQDAEGEITATHDWSHVTPELLYQTFAQFVGEQMQIPPMVSAKKQGGKRLYKLARKGLEVEREPKPITISRLEITEINLPEVAFSLDCSKGTYVRTLCSDIGRKLNCGAFLKELTRISSGPFHLDDAYDIEEIRGWNKAQLMEKMIPMEQALTYC